MKILIVTYYRYPNGDAGAIRQHSFVKLYQSMGHDVFVIGVGNSPYLKHEWFDEVDYVSFRNKGNGLIAKAKNVLRYKKNLVNFLKKERINYDIIQVISIPFHALLWVKRYAKKNNLKLIHDSVEWYSPNQFKTGKLSLAYILKEVDNRLLIDKSFNVIAISKFLESHFISRGIKSVRIPAILDVQNISYNKNVDIYKLTIVYAGSPGKKDYLKEVIDGLALLTSEELQRIELRILGVTKEQMIKVTSVASQNLNKLAKSTKVLGRVSRETVLENLEQADFTVLLRPIDQRYAKAGFPTKVVESLSSGTPVICNITSDLGDYLKDMENSIIVKECSAEGFSKAVKKALNLTNQQKKEMYIKARSCAEKSFDYRKYAKEIGKVIK